MSEVIDLFGKPYKPAARIISLMKATSFQEYNEQFLDKNAFERAVLSNDYMNSFNRDSWRRAIEYLNRDNAQVLKNGNLIIAHKFPDGQVQDWSQKTFREYYKHEKVYVIGFQNGASCLLKSQYEEITPIWLSSASRRRYNSYDEYIKSLGG
jgi:hypothetical protein